MKLDPETIRAIATWGEANEDHYYWGYDEVSEKLRTLAIRLETTGELGGPLVITKDGYK